MKQIYFTAMYIFGKQKTPLIFLLSLMVMTPLTVTAQLTQDWVKIYEKGSLTVDAEIGPDQNPVILTTGKHTSGIDGRSLMKLNNQGDVLWLVDLQNEEHTVEVDAVGNIYTKGNFVSKFSATGQLLWEFYMPEMISDPTTFQPVDDAFAVDDYGNVYVAGMTARAEVTIVRLSNTGQKQWTQTLPFNYHSFTELTLTAGDALYLGGTEIYDMGYSSMTLIKLNSQTGQVMMRGSYTENGEMESGYRLGEVLLGKSGNVYLAGSDWATGPVSHTNLALIKLSPDGQLIWEREALFEHRDYFIDAMLDAQENIVLLSRSQLLSGSTAMVTSMFSTGGELLWSNTYSTDNMQDVSPVRLATMPDGSIAALGSFINQYGKTGAVLLLYNSSGAEIGREIYGQDPYLNVYGKDLIADASGRLYMAVSTYEMAETAGSELQVLRYSTTSSCASLEVKATGGSLDCISNSLQLQATSAVTGATYAWRGPDGLILYEQNPVVTSQGNYLLTVTDPASGCEETVAVEVLPPAQRYSCHDLNFNSERTGLIESMTISAGTIGITGKKRNEDGSFAAGNYAALFDSQAPTGDDTDLYTTDWGNVLIINKDRTATPDDNEWGGELVLDFSAIGPVTMESLRALDIDDYERSSWVTLYGADGQELYKAQFDDLGQNSKQVVSLGNTKGVMKVVVTFAIEEGVNTTASGAIDNIKFCIERPEAPCEETGDAVQALKTSEAVAYPTPSADKTTIAFKGDRSEKYIINVFDLKGKLVQQLPAGTTKKGEINLVEMDGSNLPNGMYIARIVSDSGTKTVKLIISR